ncbi:MAG: hypothetical protein ABL879_18530 [Devosia sp.]
MKLNLLALGPWRSLMMPAVLMLCACASVQPERRDERNLNWGHSWWGMSRDDFLSRYPDASVVAQREVWLPATRLESDVALRDLIAPGSRVRFWFDDGDAGYLLTRISFIAPKSYDETMLALRREFGRQITGEDTEASCFNTDGSRRAYDPSGVGHVLALCMGAASFVDRRHRNCVYVGGSGASWPYLGTPSDDAFQFVELSTIEACA